LTDKGDGFVKISHLTKRYGGLAAVDGVSLEVGKGHTLALLGPSGCGKTTVLRCLAGLEQPNEGFIEIAGNVVFDHKQRLDLLPEHRQLGIVFQSYAVWPHMTVAENVGFPLKVRNVPKAEREQRVRRILDTVGLGDRYDRSATDLSGGQQQRVALARALVHEPRLVLFDEALSNLDAQLREQMRMELKILQNRLGFTAIYVTHDQAEAFALAEHVVLMNRGRIETQGKPRDVFRRPATAFVARFLGLNVVPGTVLAVDGEMAQVRVGDSLILRGTVTGEAALKPGDAIVACMRREHIALAKTALPGASQSFAGRITAVSFLGLDEEYVLNSGGTELRVVQRGGDIAAGDDMVATLPPENCFILRADAPDAKPLAGF
jgi:ABC-type Fe3+/spermidine/putrescine transport system ATPase subunit